MTSDTMRPPLIAWLIAGAMLILLALVNGLTLAGVSVFDAILLQELNTEMGALKFRDLLGLACAGLSAPFVGAAADRFGVRPVIAFGLLLIFAGMWGYSAVTDVMHVYAVHVLLGVAFACTNIVVIIVLLTQWFETKRGVALGIVLSGTSVGGAIFPPIVAAALERFGWQDAFKILAFTPLLFLPLLLFVVRERRSSEVTTQTERTSIGQNLVHFLKKTKNLEFLALVIVAVAVFYSANTFVRHTFMFLKIEGMDSVTAAAGISTVFLFGLFGKIGSGTLLEFVPVRWVFVACQLCTLGGASMMTFLDVSYAPGALALIGIGWGGGYTLMQLVASRFFAGPELGKLMGGFVVIESLAQGMGSFLSGVLFDLNKSYTLPFTVVLCLMTVAIITTLVAPVYRIPKGHA